MDLLSLRADEALVFGDDRNDVALFQQHRHCVAMGNALPELKALARHVAGHHDAPEAIADVLRRIDAPRGRASVYALAADSRGDACGHDGQRGNTQPGDRTATAAPGIDDKATEPRPQRDA